MAKDFSSMENSNCSSNPDIHTISALSRRTVLQGGLGAAVSQLLAPLAGASALAGCASMGSGPLLGFKSAPVSTADTVTVPEGYSAQVIRALG